MKNDELSINTTNLREGAFYWHFLKEKSLIGAEIEPETANQYCLAINSLLEQKFYNNDERRYFIREMKQALDHRLVSPKQLKWLNQVNERVHFWMWSFCRLITQNNFTTNLSNPYQLNFDINAPHIYSQIGVSLNPRTANERHQLIIDYLDKSFIPLASKLSLLEHFKAEAGSLFSIGKFTWMNRKDNELYQQYAWAYNYITNNKEYSIPSWFIPTPTTEREMLDAAIAAFDIWPVDSSTKQLFILRMRKAWSQKKHRASLEKKKKQSYNFTLTTKVKKMLDRMADRDGLSRNEVLEKLITEKYLEK
ncbi:hypothetical protein [Photobacterium leiognathi]|uniref:hypothetical protein n=1 Tax=Photobacterium leiognathi TaxID=553611 RepID=UPI0029826160|nr:hypothetical protein [Photobacterium leiognathi]